MPNVTYDGTNPITDILGDLPTEREVTMTNQSTVARIEPLTNTQIPAGQTVLVNVIGDLAHAQLVKNIQQINAMSGFEVIGVASVVIGGDVGGLLLIPTGAVETVDGDYQHFATDGVYTAEVAPGLFLPSYFADLPTIDRQTDYVIDLKMPAQVLTNGVGVFVVIAEDAGAGDLINATKNLLRLSIDSYNNVTRIEIADINTPANDASIPLNPLPTADSVIMLTLTATNLNYYWDGGSGNIAVPVGFFASAPNVLVASIAQDHADIIETSIKVAEVP